MATNERMQTSSGSFLGKRPSDTPSIQRQSSKKTRSSGSTINSSIPPKESLLSEELPSKAEKDKSAAGCKCAPVLYGRVLGHTADETILTGLQTVIDLCNKLRACEDGDESGDEEPEREQDLPERDTSSINEVKRESVRSVVSAGFQVKPTMTNSAIQTASLPRVVSEILQTSGLTPEMVSKLMQTSLDDVRPSVYSMCMQTSCHSFNCHEIQTTENELRCCTECKGTMVDIPGDHCITVEEPPDKKKICKCCKCSKSKVLHKPKPASDPSRHRPCLCTNKKMSKCRCGLKDSGVEQSTEKPTEIRYAVTIISKYKEFTTFEVMKSTKNKPRQIPKSVEGVFVLRKKHDSSKNDIKRQSSKSEINGLNGVRDNETRRQSKEDSKRKKKDESKRRNKDESRRNSKDESRQQKDESRNQTNDESSLQNIDETEPTSNDDMRSETKEDTD